MIDTNNPQQQEQQPEKKVILLDASAMKISSCHRRFYLSVVQGYRKGINSNDIEFGSAVHKFRAEFRQNNGNYGPAVQAATQYFSKKEMKVKYNKKYLTVAYLHRVCLEYGTTVLEKDEFRPLRNPATDEALLEHRFAVPFYSNDDVDILLCGTMDEIGKLHNGAYGILDLKTTSSADAEAYLEGYKLSPQLLFYRLAIRLLAQQYPNSFWSDLNAQRIACFIDGVFLRGKDVVEFKRSPAIWYSEGDMDEFHAMLQEFVHNNILPYYKGLPMRYGLSNGSCETVFGKCPFFYYCCAPDAIARDFILARDYTKQEYDPRKFGE